MEHCAAWSVNPHSSGQQIQRFYRKALYCILRSVPLVCIPSEVSAVYIITRHLSKIVDTMFHLYLGPPSGLFSGVSDHKFTQVSCRHQII
jgi:hypothetical protein